jgi:hypothetical protein
MTETFDVSDRVPSPPPRKLAPRAVGAIVSLEVSLVVRPEVPAADQKDRERGAQRIRQSSLESSSGSS